jgi:hypothetical protein
LEEVEIETGSITCTQLNFPFNLMKARGLKKQPTILSRSSLLKDKNPLPFEEQFFVLIWDLSPKFNSLFGYNLAL